ncbi:hypothetical protein DKG71_40735 [Streptomyces sp. NEAU-S7GS2]|nr:hypothetical protein DKG71_40735 [Streptomyces sp. NEAU-S7GS2]
MFFTVCSCTSRLVPRALLPAVPPSTKPDQRPVPRIHSYRSADSLCRPSRQVACGGRPAHARKPQAAAAAAETGGQAGRRAGGPQLLRQLEPSVTTWREAGEQITSFAAEIRPFLTGEMGHVG